MRVSIRTPLRILAICSLAALSLSVGRAQASGVAHLDRAFGKDGIRYLPSLGETSGAALTGDGRVLVANEKEVAMLLPSGRFDPAFGHRGIARVKRVPLRYDSISSVTVDAQGRPLVVGAGGRESLIERFTAGGRPDPSFGAGRGYVLSNFGLPAPKSGGPASSYLEDAAVDSAGHIVVMGRTAIGTRPGPIKDGPSTETVHETFISRLDESGRLDRSFAAGGVFRDSGVELLSGGFEVDQGQNRGWSVGATGQVAVYTSPAEKNTVLRLDEAGDPDPGFGGEGYVPYPAGTYNGPLIDSRGGMVTWGYVEGVAHRLANGLRISRLTPGGAPDPTFGRDGSETLRFPRFYEAELGLDEQGRVLIAASLKGRSAYSESKELALIRLQPDGKLDKSFGHQGMIRIRFPRGAGEPAAYLEGMEVKGDQVVISATYCGSCVATVALVDLGSN